MTKKGEETWVEMRLLRNKIAHTYLPGELKNIYGKVIDFASEIVQTVERVKKFLDMQSEI